jgi:hypothetical protein
LTGFHTKPLTETTWPDFARLVEEHNGVWGRGKGIAFVALNGALREISRLGVIPSSRANDFGGMQTLKPAPIAKAGGSTRTNSECLTDRMLRL